MPLYLSSNHASTIAAKAGLQMKLLNVVPGALLALVLYPIVWLLLLPFRLLGVAVEGVFDFLRAILMLPARVLRGKP